MTHKSERLIQNLKKTYEEKKPVVLYINQIPHIPRENIRYYFYIFLYSTYIITNKAYIKKFLLNKLKEYAPSFYNPNNILIIDFKNKKKINFVLSKALKIHQFLLQAEKEINTKKLFDFDFHQPSNKKLAIYNYVNVAFKKLYNVNSFHPKTGFNELKYLSLNPDSKIPLLEGKQTHNCYILKNNNLYFKNKFAIHLHLYYPDLAEEFANYFSKLKGDFDLFVTTPFEKELKEFQSFNTTVIKTENKGRDVIPFYTLKKLLKYEVIGHFHSKKSFYKNNDEGNRWRKYLLDNLIEDEVVSLFNNKKLGLAFAEDRHFSHIGENRKELHKLCEMLNLPVIKNTYLFPVGNMFWARSRAIKDMFYIINKINVPKEPLPLDGTILHAMERISPYLVKKNGYDFLTVYKKETGW
jgi:hypothetical protein